MEDILKLLKENNLMLKQILLYLNKDESEDFVKNIIANMVSEQLICR